MAVKLRLARHGSKKRPYYRIVAANAASPRDGRYLEQVGTYDATRNPATITLKRDKITYWLGQGAKPTNTVQNLLDAHMAGSDVVLKPRQRPVISIDTSSKAPAEKEAKAKDTPAKAEKAPAEAKAEEAPAEEAKAEEAPAEAKAEGDDDDKSGE